MAQRTVKSLLIGRYSVTISKYFGLSRKRFDVDWRNTKLKRMYEGESKEFKTLKSAEKQYDKYCELAEIEEKEAKIKDIEMENHLKLLMKQFPCKKWWEFWK